MFSAPHHPSSSSSLLPNTPSRQASLPGPVPVIHPHHHRRTATRSSLNSVRTAPPRRLWATTPTSAGASPSASPSQGTFPAPVQSSTTSASQSVYTPGTSSSTTTSITVVDSNREQHSKRPQSRSHSRASSRASDRTTRSTLSTKMTIPPVARLAGPREASLADALARAPTPHDAVAALDEYAWRSLKAGVRVREYCAAADRAVSLCPPRGIRRALAQSPTGLLFPFDVPAEVPRAGASPSALSPSALVHLSRKQLADALARATRSEDAVGKAQALAASLEYIGRRWREGDDGSVVDAIARKMAEVEAEMHTTPGAARAVIPALRSLRFEFGFTDRTQVIAALNASSKYTSQDTSTLLSAWVVRRLASGAEPKLLISDLYNVRESLLLQAHRDAVTTTMASFALDSRAATAQWTPESPRQHTRTRTLSRLSFRGTAKRKTLGLPWLSRKLDDEDRRPSLPTHLAADTSPELWSGLGTGFSGASTADVGSPASSLCSTPSTATSTTTSTPRYRTLGMSHIAMSVSTLGVSIPSATGVSFPQQSSFGSSSATDVRTAIADHLLQLRYRLGPDADGWLLGGGRDKAIDFLDSFATKEETKDTVEELRALFDVQPREAHRYRHERDVSFDLEQYIADIGPQGDEQESPRKPTPIKHRASMVSIATTATTKSSEFTILEATRVPLSAHEAREVTYKFPSPISASASVVFRPPVVVPRPEANALGMIPRFSKSMTSLAEPRARVAAARLTVTPSFPAELPASALVTKPRKTEFPALTPPLSPTATLSTESSPSPPQASNQSVLLPPGQLHISSHEFRMPRRHQNRGHVIVDGEHLSPEYKSAMLDREEPKEKEVTLIGAILPLFMTPMTEAVAEEKLTAAIKLEEQRESARREAPAEIKAHILWLLQQVSDELADPALVAAVERAILKLTAPPLPASPHTPPHQVAVPRRPLPQRSPARRHLTIVVPPRKPTGMLASPDAETSARTFGSGSNPKSISYSPPFTPRRVLSEEGDGDRTPMRVAYGPIPEPTPVKPQPTRTASQSSHYSSMSHVSHVSRASGFTRRPSTRLGTTALSPAPSPPRVTRKPVPPLCGSIDNHAH